MARALAAARARDIRVFVVGVGTTAGGVIPDPFGRPPLHSVLDRESLGEIARIGGGQYFEIGREPDRVVASRIITGIRRRIPVTQEEESTEDLYWRFLVAAAVFLWGGSLVLSRRVELWCLAAAALVAFLIIANTVR